MSEREIRIGLEGRDKKVTVKLNDEMPPSTASPRSPARPSSAMTGASRA
jgi:hypothetical protein